MQEISTASKSISTQHHDDSDREDKLKQVKKILVEKMPAASISDGSCATEDLDNLKKHQFRAEKPDEGTLFPCVTEHFGASKKVSKSESAGNTKKVNDREAICHAARAGDLETVRKMINQNSRAKNTCLDPRAAYLRYLPVKTQEFIRKISQNSAYLIRLLLAKIWQNGDLYATALAMAAAHKQPHIVEFLLNRRKRLNIDEDDQQLSNMEHYDISLFRNIDNLDLVPNEDNMLLLTDKSVDIVVRKHGNYLYLDKATHDKLQSSPSIKLLVSGQFPDAVGSGVGTALVLAAAGGQRKIVKRLLTEMDCLENKSDSFHHNMASRALEENDHVKTITLLDLKPTGEGDYIAVKYINDVLCTKFNFNKSSKVMQEDSEASESTIGSYLKTMPVFIAVAATYLTFSALRALFSLNCVSGENTASVNANHP